ncbi:hypothetical protein [Ensifer sp. MJa1]|uniref:hypothetical protein n=1 Tax=Ensifer sp. MJa1 TaxID=2919888 RepID=UPI00300828F7
MKYVFEIIDSEGDKRVYVATHWHKRADGMILSHRGSKFSIRFCDISDWLILDEPEDAEISMH